MRARRKAPDHAKANGVHYTPPELAAFLAEVTVAAASWPAFDEFRVLDPACGDGQLLVAIARAVPKSRWRRLSLEGYETDRGELAKAEASLRSLGVADLALHHRDFLSEGGLFD